MTVFPERPDYSWMVPWAEANGLDPSRVVAGSVEIQGDRIIYDVAYLDSNNIWAIRRHVTAPLTVGFEGFEP